MPEWSGIFQALTYTAAPAASTLPPALSLLPSERESQLAIATLSLGDDQAIPLLDFIGRTIRWRPTGRLVCVGCQSVVSKFYQPGYCFRCTQKLPETDLCLVKPERCHFDQGSCRNATWGTAHCRIPHWVYLANSAGVKVGITRHYRAPQRWMEQGATAACPFIQTTERKWAGIVEVLLKRWFKDTTSWRKLIQNESHFVDLPSTWDHHREAIWAALEAAHPDCPYFSAFPTSPEQALVYYQYPVLEAPHPTPCTDLELLEGVFRGYRGYYLFIGDRALNLRKALGHEVTLACE